MQTTLMLLALAMGLNISAQRSIVFDFDVEDPVAVSHILASIPNDKVRQYGVWLPRF